MKTALSLLALLAIPFLSSAASFDFQKEIKDKADPAKIGKTIAENFIARQFRAEADPSRRKSGIIYPEACAWYGSLRVAQLTKDKPLQDKLVNRFEPLLSEPGNKLINKSAHVDYRVFGIVPFEIYKVTNDERYLKVGLELADKQWDNPTEDGITREARYWIDDMYMIPAVQVQAFRATKDPKYLDRAALSMVAYLDRLQQDNGLFHHGTNSHFFWARGNGWMAAGMAELLNAMPKDHPARAGILEGAKQMMETLLRYQSEDGMWRQLIDVEESWKETSGTAMFTFAMISGVKDGWLDGATYGPAATKAWNQLTTYLDENGNIREVCIGTNKGDTKEYYLARPRAVGDLHGQAPMLWSAAALLR